MPNEIQTRDNATRDYERWIWIELLGFDNTRPGVGVHDYIDNLGFVPKAMSFLLTSPDIVHQHAGMDAVVDLPPDICSYWGNPQNAERQRQVWTNHQLKELIDTLHSYGVQTYLATFTSYLGNKYHPEWVAEHQELLEQRKGGQVLEAILALKRFKDGTYYEDYFIPELCKTLIDYGFDGWHAADGWGPPRMPLSEADCSDDMFEQFVQSQGILVPPTIPMQCEHGSESFQARAEWVWATQRRAWLDFYSNRWAGFYQKKVDALHAIDKQIVMNSSWTRDPFEAIYRYGIDYRKLVATGIDGIVTESAAGASDMESEEGQQVCLYNYTAALLLTKAYAPSAKLIFLHGVSDTTEQWDLIHHAPTVLESEIFSLTNVFLQDGANSYQSCADGFVVCLGDCISHDEWRWLEKRWTAAFASIPQGIRGATLLWSDEALSNELDDFIAHRGATTHRLLFNLMENGAPVQSAVRIENLHQASGALLVVNAHTLPPEQLRQVFSYQNGPIITIGRPLDVLRTPSIQIKVDSSEHPLVCSIFGSQPQNQSPVVSLPHAEPTWDSTTCQDVPLLFTTVLPMQEPSEAFYQACTKLISQASGAVCVASGEQHINLQTTELGEGKLRILIRNRKLAYSCPLIDVGHPIESVEIMTEFPNTQITPEGPTLRIKVPGRGATLLMVQLAP